MKKYQLACKRYRGSINLVIQFLPRSMPIININDPNQDDQVVVTTTIANLRVHKILIDQGSSIGMLY